MKTNPKKDPVRSYSPSAFIRDSSLFSISLVLGGFCSLIRSFFVAKFLGPQGFGTWRFINIFVDYLRLASLGTQLAMSRRIPFLRGKKDTIKLKVVTSTVFTTNFFCSIIYSAGILVWSFFVTETSNAKTLAAFSPVILLVAWVSYAKEFFLASGLYSLRSQVEMVHAVSTMLFTVALVYLWGIYGAITGFGLSTLIALGICAPVLWRHSYFKIDWTTLWELIVIGLPILANGMLILTMANTDRIMIAAMLSREMLGIYSVGNAGVAILGMIPSALGQMLFVKFAEMDGQKKNKNHMSEILDRSTLILSSFFAPIVSVVLACFPIAVIFFLPKYAGGVAAGRYLIAATFFLAVSLPVTNWCVSTGRYYPVLALRVTVIAAEFIAVYVVIRNGARLELIALCVLSAFAIFSTAMIFFSNKLLGNPLSIGIIRSVRSVLPFASILITVWIQDYAYPIGAYVPGRRLILSCLLGMIVGLAVSIPFVYWANRQTQIFRLLFRANQ